MPNAAVVQWVKDKYEVLSETLNERSRRLWAAAEARSLGRGGTAAVIATTGMSSATVHKGLGELEAAERGRRRHPKARFLLIAADSGGSNAVRVRLWRWELQGFANTTGLTIHVHHMPPGTSQWNKSEHRLFSFISQNRRGRPLLRRAAIVNLTAATRTETGLKMRCMLDRRAYSTAIKVTDEQMARIKLLPHSYHGDWNYTIRPN